VPRYTLEENTFESFIQKGYLHVYVPSKLRPQLVKAAKQLGFGSLADLTRHALREYLERRDLMKHEAAEIERPPETPPAISGGLFKEASRDEEGETRI